MRAHSVWSRKASVLMTALLVVALAAAGWQSSEYARANWWPGSANQAVGPGPDGMARSDGVGAGIDQVAVLEVVHAAGGEYRALDGYRLWHIGLTIETGAAGSDIAMCDIKIEDHDGIVYEANNETVNAEGYSGSATCAEPEADDWWDSPEPVQQFVVTMPASAEPRFVRIEALRMNPRYLRLPVTD